MINTPKLGAEGSVCVPCIRFEEKVGMSIPALYPNSGSNMTVQTHSEKIKILVHGSVNL